MDDIVRETNRYATTLDVIGRTQGGPNWEQSIEGGLKMFMVVALYMGMKKQPNY